MELSNSTSLASLHILEVETPHQIIITPDMLAYKMNLKKKIVLELISRKLKVHLVAKYPLGAQALNANSFIPRHIFLFFLNIQG